MIGCVVFPWPDKRLSPNARVGWAERHRYTRQYFRDCAWLAQAEGLADTPIEAPELRITFSPPDARKRDLDNMLASIKAGIDGLASVLGVDDSLFSYRLERSAPGEGTVTIEIYEKGEAP